MQDLPEGLDAELTSEQAVTQLSSSVEQLTLSPSQQHKVREIRDEPRDCTSHSDVGVICDVFDAWKSMKGYLSSAGYKIITNFPLHYHHKHATRFATIAQSTTYPEQPTAAESSDSPPFVIAVFISGWAGDSVGTLHMHISHRPMHIVNDIIEPFLPQSALHLQHIPKLFFINSADGDPHAPPPHFPDDPDGNYCVAYHVAKYRGDMRTWNRNIADDIFLPGKSIQEVIENSRSHLHENHEHLHYFSCLKNKIVFKNIL